MRLPVRAYMIALPLIVAVFGAFLADAIVPQMIDGSGVGSLAYLEPFSVGRRRGEPQIFPGGQQWVDAILYTFADDAPLVDPLAREVVDISRADRTSNIAPIPQPNYVEPPAPADIPLPTPTPGARTASGSSGSSGKGATSSGKYYMGQVLEHIKVTHYCKCGICNGYSNAGITASGKKLTEGMIAANWLPIGSIVFIDNTYYIVEDRGVRTGQIDVYVDGGHSVAYARGKHYSTLRIVRIGRDGPMWEGATISRHPLDGLGTITRKKSSGAQATEPPSDAFVAPVGVDAEAPVVVDFPSP